MTIYELEDDETKVDDDKIVTITETKDIVSRVTVNELKFEYARIQEDIDRLTIESNNIITKIDNIIQETDIKIIDNIKKI